MESRNTKFLENDLISGSGQIHHTLFEREHYQGQTSSSSHRLAAIHTHEVETGIRQPIIENPHTFEPVDHVVKEQQNVEQPIEYPIEHQVPHEETTLRRSTRVRNSAISSDYVPHEETTLRRSTRVRNSSIPSDYVVHLQESNYNIRAKHDSETFSQAISSKESDL